MEEADLVPSVALRLGSAPFSSNSWAMRMWPALTASCRGVHPAWSCALVSIRSNSIKHLAISCGGRYGRCGCHQAPPTYIFPVPAHFMEGGVPRAPGRHHLSALSYEL